MTFSSAAFLFLFLPAVFLLYPFLPGLRAKNILLALVSVFFYAFGEPVYVILLLFSVTVNYVLARMLSGRHPKAVLWSAVVFNVLLLGVFKYAAFAAETLNLLPGILVPVPQIVLPIGISFYTFQILSYVVDVYRGDTRVQKNYWDLLFYISFFPQLIAGPIVKYHDIDEQIGQRTVTAEKCAAGIRRFIVGLAKKMLLSNTCGWIADAAFGAENPGTALAWWGAFCYCLQIYHDFSGYSDMAIGLGAMFGFDIPENFRHPYASGSIKEFWRRWHISLSTWFKEYIYIPLGGNRDGKAKMYRNKLIVFFTTGLWHGASWNFVVWGLWHGAFSILEEFLLPWKKKWLSVLWRPVTLLAVLIGFVFFRAETLTDAAVYLGTMFTASPAGSPMLLAECLSGYNVSVALFAAVLSLPVVPFVHRKLDARISEVVGYAGSVLLFAASVMSLASSTFNPFIYFRF
ncbi:MAG: MBOAT family protein [Clostridia bacterium]|nr:MBOAT family protein [Clostridia bacterium]